MTQTLILPRQFYISHYFRQGMIISDLYNHTAEPFQPKYTNAFIDQWYLDEGHEFKRLHPSCPHWLSNRDCDRKLYAHDGLTIGHGATTSRFGWRLSTALWSRTLIPHIMLGHAAYWIRLDFASMVVSTGLFDTTISLQSEFCDGAISQCSSMGILWYLSEHSVIIAHI